VVFDKSQISDISPQFLTSKKDYPLWKVTKDKDFIFNEIIEYYIKRLELPILLREEDYFKSKNIA